MKIVKALWALIVLCVGLALAWYSIMQIREAGYWILGALSFYAGAVFASGLAVFELK